MAFLQVQFYSQVLSVSSTVNVILPQSKRNYGDTPLGAEEPLPKVLYLLHGYSDDHTAWCRYTSLERYVRDMNLAVIMPAVNHSFYTNEYYGERYWDYVTEELPRIMHQFFRLSDKPEDTYVAGLSMGGYGAMKMALAFPERFAAAGSFSGAVDRVASTMRKAGPDLEAVVRVFGDVNKIEGSENDLFHLMEKNAAAPHKPKIYVACGTADFLYQDNLHFHPALKENGWDVTWYDEPDVGHQWPFWDRQIKVFVEEFIK